MNYNQPNPRPAAPSKNFSIAPNFTSPLAGTAAPLYSIGSLEVGGGAAKVPFVVGVAVVDGVPMGGGGTKGGGVGEGASGVLLSSTGIGDGGSLVGSVSACGKCVLVVVPSICGTVVTWTTLGRVKVSGFLVLPTIGSHAPVPIGRPSCSTTVSRLLRYATTAGWTNAGLGIDSSSTMSGATLVGDGKARVRVAVEHSVDTGSTEKRLNS